MACTYTKAAWLGAAARPAELVPLGTQCFGKLQNRQLSKIVSLKTLPALHSELSEVARLTVGCAAVWCVNLVYENKSIQRSNACIL